MWHSRSVSVILPAYNEAENIANAVREFASTGLVDEMIVVDNNSTDGTRAEVNGLPARLVRETRQGYGFAIRRGMREAKGDLIVLAEPDGTFDPSDLLRLLQWADHYDLVCGTRTHLAMIDPEAHMPWWLRWGNILVARLLQFLFDVGRMTDCGCGFRVIRREALSQFVDQLKVGGSHLLPEIVIRAAIRGMRIREIPLHFRRRVGKSKITGTLRGTVSTGFGMLCLILSAWVSYKLIRRRTVSLSSTLGN